MAEFRSRPTFDRRAFLTATAAAALYPGAAAAALPTAETLRQITGAPAAGIAFQKAGQVTLSVVGQRANGHDAQVAQGDLWHLGSLTKSMTAVLAARLVEQGVISFEDAIGAWLNVPDKQLQGVTLAQLLRHRGGVIQNVPNEAAIRLQQMESTTSARDIRREYLAQALTRSANRPGTLLYSNAGYVAAAAMMEAATGRSWEVLVQSEVFAPLGLTTAGFGPPGVSVTAPDQPWGHATGEDGAGRDGAGLPPTPSADNILALNPAARAHMSLSDFLAYLTAHARRDPILADDSWRLIHDPVSDARTPFAMGWIAPGGAVRFHSGSNTFWFATGGFNARGDAIALVMNTGVSARQRSFVERAAVDFLLRD